VRQRKTGRPVKFEITEQTRQTVDDYLKTNRKNPSDFLFTGIVTLIEFAAKSRGLSGGRYMNIQ
jgi:hypothetical protein